MKRFLILAALIAITAGCGQSAPTTNKEPVNPVANTASQATVKPAFNTPPPRPQTTKNSSMPELPGALTAILMK